MKAWFVTKLGEPNEVLVLNDVPRPVPNPDEVLIRVEAFALNFFDILLCQGKYQEKPPIPFTPGAEIAGVIEEVGAGATLKKGTRVLATPHLPFGGYSQYVVVPENDVYVIPEDMSFEKAAALFITYQTAYYALKFKGMLTAGETLLVHAGSGGVGSAAIQIGKALGANVIATAGTNEKLEICKQIGADVAINYQLEDFVPRVKEITAGKGADVVFDPVGGEVFQKSRKCIAFDGRILPIGFAGGTIPEVPVNHILIKNYSVVGVHFGYFKNLYPEKVNQFHKELIELYSQGKIDPVIFNTYALSEVPKALQKLGSRKTWGKLVVTCK